MDTERKTCGSLFNSKKEFENDSRLERIRLGKEVPEYVLNYHLPIGEEIKQVKKTRM